MRLPANPSSVCPGLGLGRVKTALLIAHGGYGDGDSLAVLGRVALQVRLHEPFIIKMDQERAILRDVTRWLETSDARK